MRTESGPGEALREERDQALRDLLELADQQAHGELSAVAADRLRVRYEARAVLALTALEESALEESARKESARKESTREKSVRKESAALDESTGQDESATDRPTGASAGGDPEAPRRGSAGVRPRHRGRTAAYVVAGLLALAAVLSLPSALTPRPAGGLASGNLTGVPSPAPTGRDLSTVTNDEMEAVVRANPNVVGMRLALASRYVDAGQADRALPHYETALRQQPNNAEAHAHLAWALLQLGAGPEAASEIAKARRLDPALLDAMWFDANIRLYGVGDTAGAAAVLREMQARDLTPQVAGQVQDLLTTAAGR